MYTYRDEKFHFLYSNMWDVLFSYHNGWLVYTPVAFVSLFGFYPIFKKTFLGGLKVFFFLFIVVYTLGCWSVWWYGEAFGMRPMIEFYFVVALLLGILLKYPGRKKLLSIFTVSILIILTSFNLFQSWQFKKSILPAKNLSKHTYREYLLATTPKARVFINEGKSKLIQTFFTDMESDPGWLNYASKSEEFAFSGKLASRIDSSNTFSVGFRENISPLLTGKQYQVIVTAVAYSENNNSSAQLVVDFLDLSEKSLDYNTFFLYEFLHKNRWTQIEFATNIPSEIVSDCILAVYFWNPVANEKLFVDDVRIEVWEVLD